MKKLLLITFCCFLFGAINAQTTAQTITVKGIVIDSAANKPLGYVTVALQDAATQKSIKGGLSKDNGSFELSAVKGATYQLTLISIGYKSKTLKMNSTRTLVDLGRILLSPSDNQLKEVAVTALRPIMKQEIDRLSYDVQADPESVALTALDMMRKVPLLSVDGNDNILLKGNGNYKILINGKESAMMAKSPADILRAMPASNIEKIEVITTPPAKYDAEGLAGIINIVTKKNADQGYNANISGRYNSVFGPALNVNANVKQGKFGITTFFGGEKAPNFNAGFGNIQQFTDGHSIVQSGINHNFNNDRYGVVELSYEIDSLDLLTATLNSSANTNSQNNGQLTNALNADGSVNQQYRQQTTGLANFQGFDAALNYQIGFRKKKDQLLTLSYKYSYSPNTQSLDNTFSDRINFLPSLQPDFTQFNHAGGKEHTVQVDYAEPFKAVTLEVGGKAILRDNFSNFNRSDLDSATDLYVGNPLFTDNFNYHQDVYSLYNSYQIKLGNYTAKAGLRLEHTNINADFASVDTKVNQNYTNLIPSISIQRSFKNSSINFGFTQRIQRPGISQINPFVDNSNPNFITTGNPNLRPELNNNFELTYSNFAKNSINTGFDYQFSNNSIQNVTNLKIDSISGNKRDTVTTTTYQNLGSNRSLGLNLSTAFPINKNVSFNINGRVAKVWLRGTFNGQFYQNSGITGNAFANLGYKFAEGYRAGIDAGFFSGMVNLQGSSNNFIYNSLVITKEFAKKKATISLVSNDPESKFHTYKSTTNTPQFYQENYNENPYRTFAVRFSYKIGRLNSEIKKNQHGINNDDTKGGKGGATGG